jgi:hypothetical protein
LLPQDVIEIQESIRPIAIARIVGGGQTGKGDDGLAVNNEAQKNHKGSTNYSRPAKDACAFCRGMGHWKVDCPVMKHKKTEELMTAQQQNLFFL